MQDDKKKCKVYLKLDFFIVKSYAYRLYITIIILI